MFPEYNKRAGRLFTLNDRIVDCFLRSENATGGDEDALPTPTSKEVLAVSAYLTWLGRGFEVGKNPAWRGQNVVAPASLIAVETGCAQGRSALQRTMHVLPRRGRAGGGDRRQEARSSLGTRFVE